MSIWNKAGAAAAALLLAAGGARADVYTEGPWLPITNITVHTPDSVALGWDDFSGLVGVRLYASDSLDPGLVDWQPVGGINPAILPLPGTDDVYPLTTAGAALISTGSAQKFYRLQGVRGGGWGGWGGAGAYLMINLVTWETAHYASLSASQQVALTNDIANVTTKLWLRWINPGTFTMGTNANDVVDGEVLDGYGATSHKVRLTKGFWIGVFEVTQKQYELVAGSLPNTIPADYKADWKPMCYVKYDDIRGGTSTTADDDVAAASFMGRLAAKVPGLSFDLPTEAQWEYACRAGTETSLNAGAGTRNVAISAGIGVDAATSEVGRYIGNQSDGKGGAGYTSQNLARPGRYLANAAGLYDMHGNVYEWCLDTWASPVNPALPQDDPVDVAASDNRVLRGGGWSNYAAYSRAACRAHNTPVYCNFNGGFRLAAAAAD